LRERHLNSGQARLLVVDDDPHTRALLLDRLEGQGYTVDVAGDSADALQKIQKAQYDLVLLEQIMPGMSGLDLLHLLRATYSPSDLPVIMVTAVDHSQPVADALNGGANDYVAKPVDMHAVVSRIQAQLLRVKSDRRTRECELRRDPVTGLGNRLLLLERISQYIAARSQPPALLLLDLDGLKTANDSYGRDAGDRLLVEVASRLLSVVPDTATVSRIGGDDFTVLLAEPVSGSSPEELAERILAALAIPVLMDGRKITIGGSIGIVAETLGAAEDLLRNADLAMDRAKELGKNRWALFEPEMRDRSETRALLIRDLRHAAESGQLVAVYQPKVALRTRRIVGFEALLRWRHPQRGLLAPADFIPLAEETGLIVPIGEWILRQACRQLKTWQHEFPMTPPLTMNVNLSATQLGDPRLIEHVRNILAETGIAPETLNLELTETAFVRELDCAEVVLAQLQAMHIGLKLDDFGTGYSSLTYLRALHFDSIKIDRSFVAKMMSDPESHIIVETILKLAQALEMTVIAEGIEQEPQIGELLRLGCEVGQGFYFSRPVEAEIAEQQLRAIVA